MRELLWLLPRPLIAVALLLSLTVAAAAQAGRYIPIPVRPPSPIPVLPPSGLPIDPHLPHTPEQAGGDSDKKYLGIGAAALLLYLIAVRAKSETSEPEPSAPPPDFILDAGAVAPKAERTRRLMEFLAHRERLFDPTALRAGLEKSFLRVQECWQKGDYGPLGDLLLPALRAEHESQMAAMRANGERNVLRGLRVERLEFVHLDCPADPDQQRVTALITFRAASYYVDARTGAFRRGTHVPARFQESWVFLRQGGAWHLEWIARGHVMDRLTRSNRVEWLSEDQFQHAEECVVL